MNHLDLFSGIGGFAIAAQAAGFTTIGFSEIEPYACKVLSKHWPNVPNHGDIRNIRNCQAHLVTAGAPCQPASHAGERRGAKDDRWLWPEAIRVFGESEADWGLFENPIGILTLNEGLEFEKINVDLESLGYSIQSFVIPACAIGSFQHRERVWICAHTKRQRRTGCIEDNSLSFRTKQTHSIIGNRMPQSWGELESHCRSVCSSDGVSVQMVRNQVHAYGNAIVPQVAEVILSQMAKMTVVE